MKHFAREVDIQSLRVCNDRPAFQREVLPNPTLYCNTPGMYGSVDLVHRG